MNLEQYFSENFRPNIIGIDKSFKSPYGEKKLIYADWIASGRMYKPIEDKIAELFGPMVGNTHTETSFTGTAMTRSYHYAREYIKKHCNASKEDVIITAGSGMTGMVNKLQRILGFRVPEQLSGFMNLPEELHPLVLISHMEHHSNQTSWIESIAKVKIIPPDDNGLVDLNRFEEYLEKNKERKLIIASVTAASNVTGVTTPYHKIAKLVHRYGGFCFVDFACSAPYVEINMHPDDPEEKLDAIFFSPHKFLGGPGTSGVLIFDSKLYHNRVPDQPGGGTVDWTNPWGEHKFVNNIEAREDGGTPAFIQTIKAALSIKLKEKMKTEYILAREEELINIVFDEFEKIRGLHILAGNVRHRLGAISFYVENVHYNLIVKLLNDRYGIQTRGGCSCAGTYGHYLLNVCPVTSKYIADKIENGDLSDKPGWIRLSIHPTMTNDEAYFITAAVKEIVEKIIEFQDDYFYDANRNEFVNKNQNDGELYKEEEWFTL